MCDMFSLSSSAYYPPYLQKNSQHHKSIELLLPVLPLSHCLTPKQQQADWSETMRSGRRRRGNVVHAPNPLPQEDITPGRPYVVLLSAKFIFLGLLSAMILAFSVGRAARIILIDRPRQALLDPHDQSTLRNRPDYHEGIPLGEKKPALPPISRHDRVIPKTVYTSKNFEGGTTSSFPNRRTPKDGEQRSLDVHASSDVCTAGEDGTMQCWRGKDPSYEREEDNIDTGNEEEQVHEPSGQHLLVDLKNVDFAFLDSEHRLASAVTQLIKEQSLTLLSSHCHSFEPAGVSCVAVILESHVSLHTWPVEGVITMDLFTCGSAPLLPVMPIVKRLFAIPQSSVKTEGVVQPVQIKWAHKLRGFRNHTGRANPLQTFDMGNHLLGELNMPIKNEVSTEECLWCPRIQKSTA
jgi:S-adenosylmethionine decarboxylase proenzyme